MTFPDAIVLVQAIFIPKYPETRESSRNYALNKWKVNVRRRKTDIDVSMTIEQNRQVEYRFDDEEW